jgi:hypothetical protein
MEGGAGKPREPQASGQEEKSEGEGPKSNRRLLRTGVIALALLVGVIAWVATRGDDEGDSAPEPSGLEARIVSVDELAEFADSAGHSIYWAGPIDGKELELSENVEGNVQVRYVEEGTEAGSGSAAVLTVGSYPLPDAAAAVAGFAKREGSVVRRSDIVGDVVSSAEAPTSAYFASLDGSVQVEVYDPSPTRAMSLALSGRVQPVG